MSDTILDATSLINLRNGGVLQRVLGSQSFFFGPEVEKEIGPSLAAEAKKFGAVPLDDAVIPLSIAQTIASSYSLGDGEMECLTFCEFDSKYRVCTDDRAARKAAEDRFGRPRMTGSIGLLKEAFASGTLSCSDAHAAYHLMLRNGAYIPLGMERYIC